MPPVPVPKTPPRRTAAILPAPAPAPATTAPKGRRAAPAPAAAPATTRSTPVKRRAAKPKPDPVAVAELAARDVFRLLQDAVRFQIVKSLAGAGRELNVGEIVAAVNKPQSAVSHHLGSMRYAGVVEVRKQGKNNFYRIAAGSPEAPAPLALAVSVLSGLVK